MSGASYVPAGYELALGTTTLAGARRSYGRLWWDPKVESRVDDIPVLC